MTKRDIVIICLVNIGAVMCDRFIMEVGKGPNKIRVKNSRTYRSHEED